MNKTHGFDELLVYLIHENKYMTIKTFKCPLTNHPDPRVPCWSTHGAWENSWGLQTQLESYPEQELGLKGGRKSPPGWQSHHLFTLGSETMLWVWWKRWGDPPRGHPLSWHWNAMWPWQDWTQVCQGLTLQSISVGKAGSNQRWSEVGHCPPLLCLSPGMLHQSLWSPQRPAHQHHSLKLCPSLWPHGHTCRKDQETHFQGGFVFWVAPPCRGVVGTETLTEPALGVTRGLRKVTPDGAGLGSRGPFVQGLLAGVWPVLGTLRWVREWERSRLRGRGVSNPSTDSLRELATTLCSVFERSAGWTARTGVSLGRGEWLPLGVAGGVQKRAWSFAASPLAIHLASQPAPSCREPKRDSSQ